MLALLLLRSALAPGLAAISLSLSAATLAGAQTLIGLPPPAGPTFDPPPAQPAFDPIHEHLQAAEDRAIEDRLDRAAVTASQIDRARAGVGRADPPAIVTDDPASPTPPPVSRLGPALAPPAPTNPEEAARRCLSAWSPNRVATSSESASPAEAALTQRCREIWNRLGR